jgi:hypothetical protein
MRRSLAMVEKRLKSVNTGLLMTIVILGMGIFLISAFGLTDSVTVITNIKEWNHPVIIVSIKYNVKIDRIELLLNGIRRPIP